MEEDKASCCSWPRKLKDFKTQNGKIGPEEEEGEGEEDQVDSRFHKLTEFLQHSNHDEILERLENVHLGELCNVGNGRYKTIYHTILSHAVNGDQIIWHKLDQSVTASSDNENDASFCINVNLSPLLTDSASSQTDIIKDILEFKTTATRALLTHPVIEAFLDLKWRKISKYVMLNFTIYVLFLLFYSLFLGNIFYRKANNAKLGNIKLSELLFHMDRIVFPDQVKFENGKASFVGVDNDIAVTNRSRVTFEKCFNDDPSLSCAIEIILTICIIVLTLQELFQLAALGVKQYVGEFENLIEITVLALAISSLAVQQDMYTLKWVSAFGICLAYLELIFLLGRYPLLGGTISLMFYNILQHLGKTLSNFLILVIGFSFGFFIMHHGGSSTFDHFENPGKAIVKTLVMAVGEIEFNELYAAHEGDPYSLIFTMALLVGLIIMGSLVLVNLLIAIIVSDLQDLRNAGHIQELVNKAQHIVHIESFLIFMCCLIPVVKRKIKQVDPILSICAHSQCQCDKRKVSKNIVLQLQEIVKKRRLLKQLDNHLSSSQQGNLVVHKLTRAVSSRPGTSSGIKPANETANLLHDVLELLINNKTLNTN